MPQKIDAIEIRHYQLPLEPPFCAAWDPLPRSTFTSTLVRVSAGSYEGVGSGSPMLGFAGHESLFLGHDPFDIDRHVHILDNLQFHYGRMWPLEIALWDLMGKISGEPLWKLLGGHTGKIRVYASSGLRLELSNATESARRFRKEGFPALKVRFHAAEPREDIAVVRAIREAVGSEMAILIDANQGWQMPSDTTTPWDLKTASWVADALAELDIYWLEEPLSRHDYRGLAELRRRAKLLIAGGEGNREFVEIREYLRNGSLDIYQSDVAWSSGILRARQIAREANAAGAIYSPHTWGDGLVLLANLHVAAALSKARFAEYPYDPPYWTPERRDFILPESIGTDSAGYVTLADAPGLGVEIDWAALQPLIIECIK
jgi:L-alanine-DL-glutamate epimerase-like enolase superfamily enzyme